LGPSVRRIRASSPVHPLGELSEFF
jgi:hypothetical protein